MGSYHPHRHARRRKACVCGNASQPVSAPWEDSVARREQIAREREQQARLESEKRERMAARREQRASDALQAGARSSLEARARMLFPWDLMAPDRKIAALLTGQPRGSLFPIFELARLFAGVNLGVPPGELGVSEPAANFMAPSAPRTRSWAELTQTADFFLAAQAFKGCALGRAELLGKAKNALGRLEDRLSALPDWLTVRQLRRPWFIIRPTPKTAEAMWKGVIASKSDTGP
jgi:hypothetical protein